MVKRFSKLRLPQLPRWGVVLIWVVGISLFTFVLYKLTRGMNHGILNPKGEIAERQRNLLAFATALSLLVIVPVYAMLFVFIWRYREGHKRSYKPNWDNDNTYEAIWWGIPILIISVLAVVTWVTSHSLDPYKPLTSPKTPVRVQAVAMDWKWLFIYPEQNIASVNEVVIPTDTPVEFTITSDGPMNSFWIPQLAGQIYAMSGMSTKLHINAYNTGSYKGLSSNISGAGFSDMKFTVRAVNETDYQQWVSTIYASHNAMNETVYNQLRKPSVNNQVVTYRVISPGLYDSIIARYMHHDTSQVNTTDRNTSSQTSLPDVAPATNHTTHIMEGIQ